MDPVENIRTKNEETCCLFTVDSLYIMNNMYPNRNKSQKVFINLNFYANNSAIYI